MLSHQGHTLQRNGLSIFLGCDTTMMAHVIVVVVNGQLLKTIGYQQKIQKEYKKADGR